MPIKFSVRDRDLGSTIQEAQERIGKEVPLAGRVAISNGSANSATCSRPSSGCLIVVPISIAPDRAVALHELRLGSRHDLGAKRHSDGLGRRHRRTVRVAAFPFSISAAIGFIALFGISVMDGIIVLDDFNRRVETPASNARAPS